MLSLIEQELKAPGDNSVRLGDSACHQEQSCPRSIPTFHHSCGCVKARLATTSNPSTSSPSSPSSSSIASQAGSRIGRKLSLRQSPNYLAKFSLAEGFS